MKLADPEKAIDKHVNINVRHKNVVFVKIMFWIFITKGHDMS